jgi:hypothetical protein
MVCLISFRVSILLAIFVFFVIWSPFRCRAIFALFARRAILASVRVFFDRAGWLGLSYHPAPFFLNRAARAIACKRLTAALHGVTVPGWGSVFPVSVRRN